MNRIGFIGLGNVGSKLAGSILRNGFDLTVRDLDKQAAAALLERGARWADSPRQLAAQCEVICSCLPGPQEMEEVTLLKKNLVGVSLRNK